MVLEWANAWKSPQKEAHPQKAKKSQFKQLKARKVSLQPFVELALENKPKLIIAFCIASSIYEVSPFESVSGVSRSDVVINPFIFSLTGNEPKAVFLYQFGKW